MFGGDDDGRNNLVKSKTRKKYGLPRASIHKIMQQVGGNLIAADAVDYMASIVYDMIKGVTTDALKIVTNNRRIKLTRDDIDLVYKMKLK